MKSEHEALQTKVQGKKRHFGRTSFFASLLDLWLHSCTGIIEKETEIMKRVTSGHNYFRCMELPETCVVHGILDRN